MSLSEPMIVEVNLNSEELERLKELREMRMELINNQLTNLQETMLELTKTKSMANEFSGDQLSMFRLKRLLQEKMTTLCHPGLSDRHLLFEELSLLVDLAEA